MCEEDWKKTKTGSGKQNRPHGREKPSKGTENHKTKTPNYDGYWSTNCIQWLSPGATRDTKCCTAPVEQVGTLIGCAEEHFEQSVDKKSAFISKAYSEVLPFSAHTIVNFPLSSVLPPVGLNAALQFKYRGQLKTQISCHILYIY